MFFTKLINVVAACSSLFFGFNNETDNIKSFNNENETKEVVNNNVSVLNTSDEVSSPVFSNVFISKMNCGYYNTSDNYSLAYSCFASSRDVSFFPSISPFKFCVDFSISFDASNISKMGYDNFYYSVSFNFLASDFWLFNDSTFSGELENNFIFSFESSLLALSTDKQYSFNFLPDYYMSRLDYSDFNSRLSDYSLPATNSSVSFYSCSFFKYNNNLKKIFLFEILKDDISFSDNCILTYNTFALMKDVVFIDQDSLNAYYTIRSCGFPYTFNKDVYSSLKLRVFYPNGSFFDSDISYSLYSFSYYGYQFLTFKSVPVPFNVSFGSVYDISFCLVLNDVIFSLSNVSISVVVPNSIIVGSVFKNGLALIGNTAAAVLDLFSGLVWSTELSDLTIFGYSLIYFICLILAYKITIILIDIISRKKR